MLHFINELPAQCEVPDGEEKLEVSVVVLIPNVPQVVTDVMLPFFRKDLEARGLFSTLRTQLNDNIRRVTDAQRRSGKGFIYPLQHNGEPVDIVIDYLGQTPLLLPFSAKVPNLPPPTVEIPTELAYSGTYVLGTQNSGKTVLLTKLILDRMEEPCSIIVFDTKPELSLKLRQYKFPKETLVITPDPYLALNPFDIGTKNLDIFMGLFGALGAGFTTLQSQALQQIVYLTSKVQNPTFRTFFEIVSKGGKDYANIIATFDPQEAVFWEEYPGGEYKSTRTEIIRRLQLLTPPESISRTMFNAPNTRVKIAPLMNSDTLTIIDCTRDQLGATQTEFFGRLFLAMIQAAGEQRARSRTKHPCYIFMDEADTIISRCLEVPEIIYRLRSQRIAFLAAHQSLDQIEHPRVQSALNDCAIRYVNARNDAPKIAQSMGVDADFIRTLRQGEFALSLQGQPAERVKIPLPSFPYPKLTQIELQERHEKFRKEYCYPPEQTRQTTPEEPPDDTPASTWRGKRVL